MSRLLIKNIPLNATSESLRTHLSSTKHGTPTITDIHVARKRDGTPRRFAFVGFKTEDEARMAKEWFHGTFWGTQKITVEAVQGVKDAPSPKPNKRPRLNGPDHTIAASSTKHHSKKLGPETPSTKEDDLTVEFLSVMNPHTKQGPAWADGRIQAPKIPSAVQRPSEPVSIPHDHGERDAITHNENVSDLDWLKSRMSKDIREGKDFEQSDDEDCQNAVAVAETKPEETLELSHTPEATRHALLSCARLFIRNLTYSCTEEELYELFSRFGQIEQVHIPLTAEHTSKGIAFVSFSQSTAAVAAWEALDGTTFQGRLLHILAGIERRKNSPPTQGMCFYGKKGTLKEDREEKRKREAGKNFTWATLYMNSDAVVSSIADRMNIPKADILMATESEEGASSRSPAVKLALAETHIIQETRRYFEDQGVVLETLSTPSAPRSRTTILIKNIPYGTMFETLEGLFKPHGDITRLLIAPSGTLAIVGYMVPEEAARAFRAIAYRRIGNSIIYLEWAPDGLLVEGTGHGDGHSRVKPVTISEQDESRGEEVHSIRSGSTLFVKNLSFVTTSDRLVQTFRNLPSFSFARVQTKPAPPNRKTKSQPHEGTLSMGYGFVGFADADAARKAMMSMQGFVLDGHKLLVTFAGRGTDEEEKKVVGMAKAKTPKMIVKNIPFEATKKDIRDLFGVYGTLKSVRLPKRFDARTRGFAFLEFISRHEAENAFAALRHTHLLGRHLVLDWAEEGEHDVELLRRKVGIGFGGGGELPGKKRKLDITADSDEDDS